MPRILLDMAEDIHPAADLRVNAEDLLRQVQETRRPIVLTQEGKGTAVLVTAAWRMSKPGVSSPMKRLVHASWPAILRELPHRLV